MVCLEATKLVEVVVASSNTGKIAEIKALFNNSTVTILSIGDEGVPHLDIDETGTTFAENAELKARAFAAATNLPVLADDSGIEVDALNGNPGVKSARWFPGTDQDRNDALLAKLDGEKNRTAHFKTVVCYLENASATPHFFEGVIDGTINNAPMGTEGFGYDPLFIPKGYSQSFAELGVSVKNTLSHRAIAFTKAREYIQGQK